MRISVAFVLFLIGFAISKGEDASAPENTTEHMLEVVDDHQTIAPGHHGGIK